MKSMVLRVLGAFLLPAVLAGQGIAADGPSLSGFVDLGYNYNFNGQTFNTLRSFDTPANSFTLQNAELAVEGKSSQDVGYRVDLDFGQDASLTNYLNKNAGDELDIQQAYLTMVCPITGGTFTVGKFVTPFGAEVIEAKDNFNISRGDLFNFAIPLHHTGIKYDKSFGDLGLTAGIVNGWDNLYDNNKGKTLMLQASHPFGDKVKAVLGGAYGPEQTAVPGGTTVERNGRSLVDALVTVTPMDNLTLIGNYDWGVEEGLAAPGAGNTTQNWSGLALHAKYDFSETMSGALRWETFDDEGSRTGTQQVLNSTTLTLQHAKGDMIARVEYRMDGSTQKVYVDDKLAPDDSQNTLGLQVIYSF